MKRFSLLGMAVVLVFATVANADTVPQKPLQKQTPVVQKPVQKPVQKHYTVQKQVMRQVGCCGSAYYARPYYVGGCCEYVPSRCAHLWDSYCCPKPQRCGRARRCRSKSHCGHKCGHSCGRCYSPGRCYGMPYRVNTYRYHYPMYSSPCGCHGYSYGYSNVMTQQSTRVVGTPTVAEPAPNNTPSVIAPAQPKLDTPEATQPKSKPVPPPVTAIEPSA